MKLPIIFWREYSTRVKSKGFILSTLLGPVALFLMVAIPVASVYFFKDSKVEMVAVVDPLGEVVARLKMPDGMRLKQTQESVAQIRAKIKAGEYGGYLVIPPDLVNGKGEAVYYSEASGGMMRKSQLADAINTAVRQYQLDHSNLSERTQKLLEQETEFKNIQLTESGEKSDASEMLYIIGFMMGMGIYTSVLIYGSLVMRSVMEEKVNRIVEVIISCVKPFELMMGKVLGIGALGVTQMLIWSVFGLLISSALGVILGLFISPADLVQNLPSGQAAPVNMEQAMAQSGIGLPDLPVSLFVWFILFFAGGYFLYSSMFAAVGAVVEQESDAQQFMLPVMFPIIISVILLQFVLENPNSSMSVWASMIPFCSPVLMIVRIATANVPFWEAFLSFALLVAAFIAMTWLAARIYRIGILSYGKKPTFRDIAKWIRY